MFHFLKPWDRWTSFLYGEPSLKRFLIVEKREGWWHMPLRGPGAQGPLKKQYERKHEIVLKAFLRHWTIRNFPLFLCSHFFLIHGQDFQASTPCTYCVSVSFTHRGDTARRGWCQSWNLSCSLFHTPSFLPMSCPLRTVQDSPHAKFSCISQFTSLHWWKWGWWSARAVRGEVHLRTTKMSSLHRAHPVLWHVNHF